MSIFLSFGLSWLIKSTYWNVKVKIRQNNFVLKFYKLKACFQKGLPYVFMSPNILFCIMSFMVVKILWFIFLIIQKFEKHYFKQNISKRLTIRQLNSSILIYLWILFVIVNILKILNFIQFWSYELNKNSILLTFFWTLKCENS